ncbi:MAG: AAA family ATPase [Nitriliruptorales bacterium]|nr:AAA family ATPase [Nitriliruptorales bacterium]
MQLVTARVRQFRSIIDSGRVSIQHSATCLVGKNDSGKTAFLQALYRLNPVHPEDARFSVVEDYPRWRSTKDRRSMDLGKVVPIEAEFILEADDRSALEPLVGAEIWPSTFLTASRSYNGELAFQFRTEQRDLVRRLVAAVELNDPDREAASAKDTLEELREWADSTAASAGRRETARVESLIRLHELARQYAAMEGEPTPQARELLQERLPKLFYFNDYSLIPGRIDLPKVLERDPGELSPQDRTCVAFLQLGGIGREALHDADFEARIAGLEVAAMEISREIFAYWAQEPPLLVNLMSDNGDAPGGGAPRNQYIDVRLHDPRHGMTINLDAHSSGFRWFFSFISAFSSFAKRGERAIILLDEPGPNLHPRAQRDLLRFVDERLAGDGQVIYTTHSPFMVQASALERVRTVEDVVNSDSDTGTIIRSTPFSSDPDTLLPLQAALAQEAVQSFADHDGVTLLVPQASDYIFVTELSRHLARVGRNALSEGVRVIPLGDLARLALFTRLIGPKGALLVLLDGRASADPEVHELPRQGRLSPWGLISLGQICGTEKATVEDLLAAEDYLRLYNGAFGQEVKPEDLPADGAIVERLEQHGRQGAFDRELPANELLRTRPAFLESLNPKSVEQFEKFSSMLRLAG